MDALQAVTGCGVTVANSIWVYVQVTFAELARSGCSRKTQGIPEVTVRAQVAPVTGVPEGTLDAYNGVFI